MAKAVLMLALIKEKLNSPRLSKDCLYFDEKNGLRAANRIKRDLRKVRDMSQKMYKEILEAQKEIKRSHGRVVKQKEKRNAPKNPFKKLSDS